MSRRIRLLAGALALELLALCAIAAIDDLRAHPGRFLLLFGVCAVAMLGAWRLARNTLSLGAVIVIAVALRVPFFFSTPSLSDDVWRYLHDGRAQTAGVSPYRFAPADARSTPYRGAEHARINHPELVTIYPPAAQLAFAANAATGATLFGWRLLLLACEMALLILLARLRATPGNLVLYAWHPLAVIEAIGSAHLEPVGIALLVAGVYAAARHRRVAAGLLLGLSIATKFVAAPLLLLGDRSRNARTLAAAAAAVVAVYALYWTDGAVFGSLSTFAASWEGNGSVYTILSLLTDGHRARIMAATVLLCVFVVLLKSQLDSSTRAAAFVLALLLVSPVAHPWYLLWLLALVPLLGPGRLRAVALVWSITIALSYGGMTLLEYLPVYALLTAAVLRHFRSRTSAPSPERRLQTPI